MQLGPARARKSHSSKVLAPSTIAALSLHDSLAVPLSACKVCPSAMQHSLTHILCELLQGVANIEHLAGHLPVRNTDEEKRL